MSSFLKFIYFPTLQSTTEGPCLELPEVLQQYREVESSLRPFQDVEAVQQVCLSFRDFCSLLWLLHARDKLSYNLRSREKYLNDVNYQDYLRVSIQNVKPYIPGNLSENLYCVFLPKFLEINYKFGVFFSLSFVSYCVIE